MTQEERLLFLIEELLKEIPDKKEVEIPEAVEDKKNLLRALMNVRPPLPIKSHILKVQDAYLQEEKRKKQITDIRDLTPIKDHIYLWKGDITTLKVDAIVNAANRQMLGCFYPCHGCIDNTIHTYAGMQLRLACKEQMQRQGHPEPTGQAKITPAFHLPSTYIIHTVGPIISDRPTQEDCDLLASCYDSCLQKAQENQIESIAFCCISTGEFHFPNEMAAKIAIDTVQRWTAENQSKMKVIFNVFKELDYEIYNSLLRESHFNKGIAL